MRSQRLLGQVQVQRHLRQQSPGIHPRQPRRDNSILGRPFGCVLLVVPGTFAGWIVQAGHRREQPHRTRRGREDSDRLRPPDIDRVGVALHRQHLRDPVHHRHEEDHIAGVRARHQRLQPVLIRLPRAHEPRHRGRQPPVLGRLRIDLDDLGLHQRHEPAPRQRPQIWRGHRIHPPRLVPVQPRRRTQPRDLPRLPHPALTAGQQPPQHRMPVPDVQRITDQRRRRDEPHPLQRTELRRRELPHHRRPVRRQPP
jgi:hypothetical protein